MNKNMLLVILFFSMIFQCFAKEFKYRDYEYSKYERVSMEYSSYTGGVFIEESPKNIFLKFNTCIMHSLLFQLVLLPILIQQ